MATKIIRNKNSFVLLNEDLSNISDGIFTYFENSQEITSTRKKAGRGTVTFFRDDQLNLVHKAYRRGGLIRKLISNFYLWTGLTRTRAYIEFVGLKTMLELGLSVPKPVAARIVRQGIFYKAELITQEIEDATTFGKNLAVNNLSTELLEGLGRTIKSFHRKGFMHPDLNVENILIDSSKQIFFLDFDQARPLKPKKIQDSSDVERFKRSIKKFCLKSGRDFPKVEWETILKSYDNKAH